MPSGHTSQSISTFRGWVGERGTLPKIQKMPKTWGEKFAADFAFVRIWVRRAKSAAFDGELRNKVRQQPKTSRRVGPIARSR